MVGGEVVRDSDGSRRIKMCGTFLVTTISSGDFLRRTSGSQCTLPLQLPLLSNKIVREPYSLLLFHTRNLDCRVSSEKSIVVRF